MSLQDITDRIRKETKIPGISVYVISEDFGSFSVVSGVSDLSTNKVVTENTVFRIGSITKTFTGAAILQLIAQNKLTIDDKINHYLEIEHPLLKNITVRHLLNQSSGLRAYLNDSSFLKEVVFKTPTKDHMPKELLDWAFTTQKKLHFMPGTSFEYTNTNYILLGMLIEKISGMSYKAYIEKMFLTPLMLTNSFVLTDEQMPGDDYAHGYYDFEEDHHYEDWTQTDMSYVWAAGCMASTAYDLARWMDALGKGLIIDKSVSAFHQTGIELAPQVVYGAGILTDPNRGVGHNGTVIGFHADTWYNPELKIAIAVLSNANMIEDEPYEDEEPEDRDPTAEIVTEFFNFLRHITKK